MQNIKVGSIVTLRKGELRMPLCKQGFAGGYDWFHWTHKDMCKGDIGLVLQIIRHPLDQRFWAQIQIKENSGWISCDSIVAMN